MYTESYVRKINPDGSIIVGCDTQACRGCKVSMFCSRKKENTFSALNPDGIKLSENDKVRLYMSPGKTVFSTVLVFALPLIVFPLGYVAAKHFFSFNEIVNALCGFGAMGLAFAVSAVVSTKRRNSLMPVVEEVLSQNP
ncbi:MAG: SoxR reducing system RseC family protein [Sphaerochaetaceae bacterium]|nr:SoxR reducing system RseC family protein [Sphaerochaetaceae bacterium]